MFSIEVKDKGQKKEIKILQEERHVDMCDIQNSFAMYN